MNKTIILVIIILLLFTACEGSDADFKQTLSAFTDRSDDDKSSNDANTVIRKDMEPLPIVREPPREITKEDPEEEKIVCPSALDYLKRKTPTYIENIKAAEIIVHVQKSGEPNREFGGMQGHHDYETDSNNWYKHCFNHKDEIGAIYDHYYCGSFWYKERVYDSAGALKAKIVYNVYLEYDENLDFVSMRCELDPYLN